MAKAFKCDRCAAYDDGEPIAGVTFKLPVADSSTTPQQTRSRDYQLCVDCLASLQDWIHEHINREVQGDG